jgi:hypothetical protein
MKSDKSFHPTWWSEQHASTWERVKAAMRRDFEQTKNDFSGGPDLDQDVDDTLKQAVGRAPVPTPGARTPPSTGEREKRAEKRREKSGDRELLSEQLDDTSPMVTRARTEKPAFDDVEDPLSFGYAARAQYETRFPKWSPELESTLRKEWMAGAKDRPWDDVSIYVRQGFEAPRGADRTL